MDFKKSFNDPYLHYSNIYGNISCTIVYVVVVQACSTMEQIRHVEDNLVIAFTLIIQLIIGNLYRHCESSNGKSSSNIVVVPSSKMKEVLKEFQ